jgi:hypothetical protein
MMAGIAALSGLALLLGPGAGAALAGEAAFDTEPPEVELAPGNRLVCNPGSWEGAGVTFTYTWLRNGSAVKTSSNIPNVYPLSPSEEGFTFTCVVTGKNSFGSESEESWNSYNYGHGLGSRPENEVRPEITGTPKPKETLTCSPGTWGGTTPITYTYQWLREGIEVASATQKQYTVLEGDKGYSLTCKVTASNQFGKASALSRNSAKIVGEAPKYKKAPEVLGAAGVGKQLTCSPGEWTGSPAPTFTYTWLRDGKAIAGATGTTYLVESADELHTISCAVRAESSEGSSEAPSSNNVKIPGSPPVNVTPPTVTGVVEVGQKITCSPGTWSGVPAPAFGYQWFRNAQPIAFATASGYTIVAGDAGRLLSCEVVATSSEGHATEVSKPVPVPGEAPPEPSIPENIVSPEITGTPKLGEKLKCSQGEWRAVPPAEFKYQWMRERTPIGGQVENSYTIAAADLGVNVSCRVTAKNTEGTSAAESKAVAVEGIKPKEGLEGPTILGAGVVGESLTCSPGSWTAAPTATFTYHWLRSGVAVASGNDHVVSKADMGYQLVCEVIASNREGSTVAVSEPLAIPGIPPGNTSEPKVAGPASPIAGDTLTCSRGEWYGDPEPTFTYQWLTDGGPINGATESTYVITKFDEGHSLACEVTATNSAGEEHATSKRIHIPGAPPEDIEAPRAEGTPEVGEPLTCSAGLWHGKPPPAFTYQWLVNGSEVPEATAETFTPEPEDLGAFVSCVVTGTNVEGNAQATSPGVEIKPRAVKKLEAPTTPPFTDPPTSKPTKAQVLSALEEELSAILRHTPLSSLRKHGWYSFGFLPLEGGTLEVLLYQVPKGAHVSANVKPFLVARAKASFTTKSKKPVKLTVTSPARPLIKPYKSMKLTVKAAFTPTGASAVTWVKPFVFTH